MAGQAEASTPCHRLGDGGIDGERRQSAVRINGTSVTASIFPLNAQRSTLNAQHSTLNT